MTRPRLSFNPRLIAFCAVALAAVAGCEKATQPRNGRVEVGLQQILDQAVAKPDVFLPGAIAYYGNPTYAPWSGSAGQGDLQAQSPIASADRIRAGSILKTFVATVTLQHVEEGTLSLDQTLTQLLPASVTDRVANAGQISLRMLLNHTSGIPNWLTPEFDAAVASDPAHIYTDDELIDIAAALPAVFPPGTSWSYSNTNYTLVGMVLDRAGGKSWRAQVRERVLVPLGLTSSSLPEPGDRTTPGSYAHGYQDFGGTPVDLSQVDPSMGGASGGNALITTVGDLARFIDTLLAGGLFKRAETLVAMTTMVDAPSESGLPHRYGLGLETYSIGETTVIGNAGGAAGYATMMFQIPAHETTLVTSVNTSDLFANALEVFIPAVDVITAPAR